MAPKRTLAVHGGAGAWSEELRPLAMEGIERALDAGLGAFGGGPLDACVAAVLATARARLHRPNNSPQIHWLKWP